MAAGARIRHGLAVKANRLHLTTEQNRPQAAASLLGERAQSTATAFREALRDAFVFRRAEPARSWIRSFLYAALLTWASEPGDFTVVIAPPESGTYSILLANNTPGTEPETSVVFTKFGVIAGGAR